MEEIVGVDLVLHRQEGEVFTRGCFISHCFSTLLQVLFSLHELCGVSFEPLFAGYAAEVIGFTAVGDLELGCLLVQNRAANWISRHLLSLNLMEQYDKCLLLLMVKKRKV